MAQRPSSCSRPRLSPRRARCGGLSPARYRSPGPGRPGRGTCSPAQPRGRSHALVRHFLRAASGATLVSRTTGAGDRAPAAWGASHLLLQLMLSTTRGRRGSPGRSRWSWGVGRAPDGGDAFLQHPCSVPRIVLLAAASSGAVLRPHQCHVAAGLQPAIAKFLLCDRKRTPICYLHFGLFERETKGVLKCIDT